MEDEQRGIRPDFRGFFRMRRPTARLRPSRPRDPGLSEQKRFSLHTWNPPLRDPGFSRIFRGRPGPPGRRAPKAVTTAARPTHGDVAAARAIRGARPRRSEGWSEPANSTSVGVPWPPPDPRVDNPRGDVIIPRADRRRVATSGPRRYGPPVRSGEDLQAGRGSVTITEQSIRTGRGPGKGRADRC